MATKQSEKQQEDSSGRSLENVVLAIQGDQQASQQFPRAQQTLTNNISQFSPKLELQKESNQHIDKENKLMIDK